MRIAFFSMNRSFAEPLLRELTQYHTVRVWQHNSNEWINQVSIKNLMDWCELAYCEWLQPPNMEISQIQGWGKPIVAFCHGIDAQNHSFMDWRNIAGLIIQDANYARFMRFREIFSKQNPHLPPLAKLPKTLIKSIGADSKQFQLIPRAPGYKIITHASSVRATKGIYEAIGAFYDLLQVDSKKPWTLTIVGDWYDDWELTQRREYLEACDERIEKLNFPSGRIFITDKNFDRATWKSFLGTADIYWCLSWRESFGVSLAEAALSGVYPLVNDYFGAETIYSDQFRFKTTGELVQKTILWGERDEATKKSGQVTARNQLLNFDSGKAAVDIRLFLEAVAQNYPK